MQQQDSFHDDVVKVQRAGLAHLFFVQLVHVRDLFAEVVARGVRGKLFRGHQLVLGARDHADDRARVVGLGVEVQLLEHVRDHALFIVLIVDGEGGLVAQQVAVPPQDAQAGGVEGVRPDRGGGFFVVQRSGQALAQLARGLVGEGDRDDLPRLCRMHGAQPLSARAVFRLGVGQVFGQEQQVVIGRALGRIFAFQPLPKAQDVDDAVDEHGGLAAARPRQNEQGAFGREHSLALLFIQAGEALLDDRAPHGGVFEVKFSRFHGFPRFVWRYKNSIA